MNNFSEDINEFSDLGAMYLMLGHACNMTCRHCVQIPLREDQVKQPHFSDNILEYIANWSKQPWKYNQEKNPRRLYFWGGEPLLYWKEIKRCILELESKGCKAEYRIFTNGLLLDDEKVQFINNHSVSVTMSYDAPNPNVVRTKVPSKEVVNHFLKINKRFINSVFSNLNINMVEALKTLESIVPNTTISIGFINVLHNKTPKDLWHFKEGSVAREVRRLFRFACEDKSDLSKYAKIWFESKCWRNHKWNKEEFNEVPVPPCRPGIVSLSIDEKGDVFLCHNSSEKVANIFVDSFEHIQKAHIERMRQLLPKKCNDCECLPICRCICPIAVKEDDELCYCDYLKEFWSEITNCTHRKVEVIAGKTYKLQFDDDDRWSLVEGGVDGRRAYQENS